MTAEPVEQRDYQAEQDARMAWLEANLKRGTNFDVSQRTVELGDALRLRILHSSKREWRIVAHRPEESPVMRRMGFLFQVESDPSAGSRHRTLRQALVWIAIHWDYLIDRLLAQSGQLVEPE